jgi:hypothetical protein
MIPVAAITLRLFKRFRGKSPICEALAWNIAAISPAAKIKKRGPRGRTCGFSNPKG